MLRKERGHLHGDAWTLAEPCGPGLRFAHPLTTHQELQANWHVEVTRSLNCGAWLGQFLVEAADHRECPWVKCLHRKFKLSSDEATNLESSRGSKLVAQNQDYLLAGSF